MDFNYSDEFGPNSLPDAYERLLLDVSMGDASLFTRADQTELSWQLIDPILQGWQSSSAPPLSIYEPGTWGLTIAPVCSRVIIVNGSKYAEIAKKARFPNGKPGLLLN